MQVSDQQCLGCARITSSKHFWLLFTDVCCGLLSQGPERQGTVVGDGGSAMPSVGKEKGSLLLATCCYHLGLGRRCGNVFLPLPHLYFNHFLINVCLQHVRDPTKTCGLLRGTLGSGRPYGASHCWLCSASGGMRVPFLFLPCQPLQNKVLFCLVLWHSYPTSDCLRPMRDKILFSHLSKPWIPP